MSTSNERQPLLRKSSGTATPPPTSLPLIKALLLIPSFCTLLLFFVINNSNVIPLQGPLAKEFDAFDQVTWFLTVMNIAYSAGLPLMGRLSAIFSARLCCLVGAFILSFGLLLCGFAPSLAIFLIGRAFCGVGSAACLVTSFILLIQVTPVHLRPFYISILNSVYTLGFPLGGVIGGLAVDHWRPSFYLQAPCVLIAATIVYAETHPKKSDPSLTPLFEDEQTLLQKLQRVDYLGIFLLVSSLCLSLVAFNMHPLPKLYIAASAVLFALFWVVESMVAKEPLIPAAMLLYPPVFFGCLAIMIAMTSWFCFSFYVPVEAISVFGLAPEASGLYFLPATGSFAIGGVVIGYLARSKKPGSSYLWEALLSIGFYMLFCVAFVVMPKEPGAIQVPFFCASVGVGVATAGIISLTLSQVLHATKEEDHPLVTSMFQFFRGMAGSIGGAFICPTMLKLLESNLVQKFSEHEQGNITPEDLDMIRRLKGNPLLVWEDIAEWQHEAGLFSYQTMMRSVFVTAVVLGSAAFVLQFIAGLGHKKKESKKDLLDSMS